MFPLGMETIHLLAELSGSRGLMPLQPKVTVGQNRHSSIIYTLYMEPKKHNSSGSVGYYNWQLLGAVFIFPGAGFF